MWRIAETRSIVLSKIGSGPRSSFFGAALGPSGTGALVRVLSGIGLLGLLGCASGGAKTEERPRPPPLVVVGKVKSQDVEVTVRAPVDLRPLAQADVGAKSIGYLDAVLVERGDRVKQGQALALVRPSDLPDQLAAARGALAQARAAVALARSNHERAERLAPKGVISEQQRDSAANSLATSEATEASALAQMAVLATRLGETRIVSPLDGVVTSRRVDPGALVGPTPGGASIIVSVARVDTLRGFLAFSERNAGGLAVGKLVRVELDALPGRLFEGKVIRVAPGFEPTARTLDAEVQLDNAQGELRPGMYGRATVVLDVHPGRPVVPVEAVRLSGGKRSVFVVKGDRVERRAIQTGVDGELWFEVLSGLQAGETIVTSGLEGLADGSAVRSTSKERPAAPAPAK